MASVDHDYGQCCGADYNHVCVYCGW